MDHRREPQTWTQTPSGKVLDLIEPRLENVSFDDVVWSMGNSCRYNGAIRHFYSTAEHQVLMSWWFRDQGADPDTCLGALLHDGAETYLGDATYPFQSALFTLVPEAKAAYRLLHDRMDVVICGLVDLDPVHLHSARVQEADLRILLDERPVLLSDPPPRPWNIDLAGLSPLGVHLQLWQPAEAQSIFEDELLLLQHLRGRST